MDRAHALLFSVDAELQRADLQMQEAALKNAQQAYERAVALLKSSAGPQRNVDDAEAALRTAQTRQGLLAGAVTGAACGMLLTGLFMTAVAFMIVISEVISVLTAILPGTKSQCLYKRPIMYFSITRIFEKSCQVQEIPPSGRGG